jgi:hypothetical protein
VEAPSKQRNGNSKNSEIATSFGSLKSGNYAGVIETVNKRKSGKRLN